MEQLNLPFLEIKKVANRNYLRENFKRNSLDSYLIPFNQIKEREGFNQRKVYDEIPELADSLFLHGQKDPMVLDILPTGEAFLDEGHRRYRAHLHNIKLGRYKDDILIEFFPNKPEVTELDRMLNQYTSNNHKKKLKPFEVAEVAHCIKNNYSEKPKSHEEIAELLGVSRQQVDNLILISDADDALKNEMMMADMKITECVALVRNKKRNKKQAEKVEEDSHRNTAPPTPFPKDSLKDELDELHELDKQAEQMKEEDGADEEVRIVDPKEKPHESKPLDLVGSKLAINSKDGEAKEKPAFDEGREEIQWCQNLIKNLDWLSVQSEKLPEQTSKDFVTRIGWIMKDAEMIRDWVSKNKKQNKRGI